MYNYIKGQVTEISTNTVTVETGGIGYELNATADLLCSVRSGETAMIYTYLQVKEDSHTLYGFSDVAERALFLQLINNVSGVGAKSALTLLSIGADTLRNAISKEDVSAISSAKGISRKTAEKVILELRGKLPPAETGEISDAVFGLVNLGLSRSEAMSIIKSIETTGKSAEQIISLALKARRK
jgi:Holliday junction DNA helicase RuvA